MARLPVVPIDDPAERRVLHARACRGDRAARNRIVMASLPLAFKFAARAFAFYQGRVPAEDLAGHAIVGLVSAAGRHDPDVGESFAATAWSDMRDQVRAGARSLLRWGPLPGRPRELAAEPVGPGPSPRESAARAVERLDWPALDDDERALVRAQYQLDLGQRSFIGERMKRRIRESDAIRKRDNGIRKLLKGGLER